MTPMQIILREDAVDEYLTEHGFEHGAASIGVALLQIGGTARGKPAIMLVIDVDGKKVLAKTTLTLMESACRAMRIASESDAGGSAGGGGQPSDLQ